ncbi:MAG: DUF1932 domain-containing protein [Chloroflexota bacterium]
MNIGILHPGEMGVSVAVSAQNSGNAVFWASEGRSEKTRTCAERHGLTDAYSLVNLCKRCSIILSICPPHAAEDLARQVTHTGFKGLYVDANAISPRRSVKIGEMIQGAGIDFVDGGIIGGPAWERGTTRLYLSGRRAEEIAACFANGLLEAKVIGEEIGKASALKMCYAAYSKGTTALSSAILATAESNGVRDELYREWDLDEEGFSEQVNQRARRVTAKAWRFEGEMREIAETFIEAGLPGGFHEAAMEIFHRLAGFKESSRQPELHEVLDALLRE